MLSVCYAPWCYAVCVVVASIMVSIAVVLGCHCDDAKEYIIKLAFAMTDAGLTAAALAPSAQSCCTH